MHDVLIVGGGPAGLSAALVLGRCGRSVLLCDDNRPRNRWTSAVHGFLTRDGLPPMELRRLAREELLIYCVDFGQVRVEDVQRDGDCFSVLLAEGDVRKARRVLIATGVEDELPDLPNVKDFYGTSIHHCPYCDGWEHRKQPIAAYGPGAKAVGLAMSLKTWSPQVMLFTNGPARLPEETRSRFEKLEIPVYEQTITALEGSEGALCSVRFSDSTEVDCRAIFFNTGHGQRSPLAKKLGCRFSTRGAVIADRRQRTAAPGVYVAGDAAIDSHYAIVAAAEGAKAAMTINASLQEEDRAAILGA